MATSLGKSNDGGEFASLKSLLLAGAGTVSVVFSLFASVLQSLVPPIEDPGVTIGWTSLTLLVLLLSLSTLFRLIRRNRTIVLCIMISVLFVIATVPTFIYYASDLRRHVVQIPPPPAKAIKRFVRGEVHAEGVRRLRGRSVDAYASDDLDGVLTTEVLWTRETQAQNSLRLQTKYVLLVLMLTGALFTAALSFIAVNSRRRASPRRAGAKPVAPE